MGQIYRLAQLKLDPNFTDKELLKEIFTASKIYNESTGMRLFVHDELFKNVINMLGNEEQIKKYDSDVDNYRIYGCFAMVMFY
jgi:acyl-CoA oxidase